MKEKNKTVLYCKDAKKEIRVWSIWREDDFICMEYGKLEGEMQQNSEPVVFGLAGRSKKEQILMRMQSRINKQIDRGYVDDLERAIKNERTNNLGYPLPMNAVALTSISQIPKKRFFWQLKLNGHRCKIINDCGQYIAYSKGGKLIETIPEIVSEIKQRGLPEGGIVDGELYHHGTPLQTISSWVRRRQEGTLKLKYKVFDANIEGTFEERLLFLKRKKYNKKTEKIRLVKTHLVNGSFDAIPILRNALEKGYEGIMLRIADSNYLSGQRSKKSIMKVKRRTAGKAFLLDDEFLVVDIIPSIDGHARLVCETETGKQFKIISHGNHQQRIEILDQKDLHIGKHVRIEFEEKTESGKPREAVCIGWRKKEDE